MSEIRHPQRAIPEKYLTSILFLADRMASSDAEVAEQEARMIDQLAKAVNMENFRKAPDYRLMSDRKACENLDAEAAKKAALVVISLVLKADQVRRNEEHEYFREVRSLLDTDPVAVLQDLEAHKALALEYLV